MTTETTPLSSRPHPKSRAVSMLNLAEKYLNAGQGEQEEFLDFYKCVLSLGRECETQKFTEESGNLMVLMSGARSETFGNELRALGSKLTLARIRGLAEDTNTGPKEKNQTCSNYRTNGFGTSQKVGTQLHPSLADKILAHQLSDRQQSISTENF